VLALQGCVQVVFVASIRQVLELHGQPAGGRELAPPELRHLLVGPAAGGSARAGVSPRDDRVDVWPVAGRVVAYERRGRVGGRPSTAWPRNKLASACQVVRARRAWLWTRVSAGRWTNRGDGRVPGRPPPTAAPPGRSAAVCAADYVCGHSGRWRATGRGVRLALQADRGALAASVLLVVFWAGLAPAALLGPTQRAVLAGPGQWQLRLLHRSILRASYAPLGFIHVALQQHEREPATAVVVSRVDQRVGGLD
jgi:hypothetical protein